MLNELKAEKDGVIDNLKETINKLKVDHKSEIENLTKDMKTIQEQMALDYELKFNNEKVQADEKILTLEMVIS